MVPLRPLLIAVALLVTGATAAGSATITQMRWQRRVLLVTAPDPADPKLLLQRGLLRAWTGGAARDLSLVVLVGRRVDGSADTASALRRRFHLPSDRFAALLIGKDGGVKLRADRPIPADTLQDTIDAMPMRQAGER